MKFISYDGDYPNLCSGTMVVEKKDGTILKVQGLSSGGLCGVTDTEEYCKSGKWDIDANQEWGVVPKKELKKLIKLANENIPFGCCGGCL